MLKHISDYISGFSDIFYINEFGDIYRKLVKEDLGNGSWVWRSTGVLYSPLVKQFLYQFKRFDEITPKSQKNKVYKDKDIEIIDCKEFYRIYGKGKEVLYLKKDNEFLVLWKKKPQKTGYKYLGTQPNRYSVHHLVYLLFVGPLDSGNVIHHIDFTKSNNFYKNLLQVSPEEHALIHDNLNH